MEVKRVNMVDIYLYNARNLCIAIFISTSKTSMSFLLLLMSSLQQNWRKGSGVGGGEKEGAGDRDEKCSKQCMCMWINE
jgi:hypothetical protein